MTTVTAHLSNKKARDYVRQYRWYAYVLAMVLCVAFGLLFWIASPPDSKADQSIWASLAPNFLASAIITALFLLSEWIKYGDDEIGHDEIERSNATTIARLDAINESLDKSVAVTKDLAASINAGEQLQASLRVGLVGAYEGRMVPNEAEYLRRFLGAEHRVDLIGLDLSSVTRRFEFYNSRFKPGLPIRILLLDPSYPSNHHTYMSQRMFEEREVEALISGAQKFCSMFARWRDSLTAERRAGLNYNIRLYRALPSVHFVRYDDEIVFGPYLIEKSSEHTFTMVTKGGTPVFEQLSEHFEMLWSDTWSRTPPDDWFAYDATSSRAPLSNPDTSRWWMGDELI